MPTSILDLSFPDAAKRLRELAAAGNHEELYNSITQMQSHYTEYLGEEEAKTQVAELINHQDDAGGRRTALMEAGNNITCARILIANGADSRLLDSEGSCFLDVLSLAQVAELGLTPQAEARRLEIEAEVAAYNLAEAEDDDFDPDINDDAAPGTPAAHYDSDDDHPWRHTESKESKEREDDDDAPPATSVAGASSATSHSCGHLHG